MAWFKVRTSSIVIRDYLIEADNEKEARIKFSCGEEEKDEVVERKDEIIISINKD